ncbi:MAG: HlyD family efflux transporter periplasmic adaptor subunit [Maritimibacter sp.]
MIDTVLGWFATLLAALIPGYGDDPTPVYNGYIEAEYVYVAPSVTARIATLDAQEGTVIFAGDFLFDQEATKQQASLSAAKARVAQAEANLRNLETGSREAEIAVIRASLDEARAQQALAKSTLERSESLFLREIVTQAKVDADRATLNGANARISRLEAQLAVAELPARDEQVIAAEATLAAARAEADLAAAQLDDMHVSAPVSGQIEKVYYDAGEVVPAGTPVISILPPDDLKVFFYLPEMVSCDGCKPGLSATITRMASDPQYTPPILYSRDERNRLVFRAEARLSDGSGLLPGQPVTLESGQ